ncbi:MAG: hypothetical protein J5I90_10950 [Caldilineales bacterium]|nr:hypothetical protein [Caldilineales bacterium]
MSEIPIIHLGLGPIGRTIARAAAESGRFRSVGAVDTDPALADRPLNEICDADLPPLPVVPNLVDVQTEPGAVVLQATVSRLTDARAQLLSAIALGHHVVSTCEELVWPWTDHPELAAEIDDAARKSGVAILGVGVNPGFVMDTLPVLLSRATDEIEAVSVKRIVNLSERRTALQRKMGVGESPERVRELLEMEMLGHVGLAASAQMLAAGLGWRLDVLDLENRPIVADTDTESAFGTVPTGACIGIRQQVTGLIAGIPRILLTLIMQLNVEGGSQDEILIDSQQCLRLRLDGLQGDQATVSLALNQARLVRDLTPGLHTMLSSPIQTFP